MNVITKLLSVALAVMFSVSAFAESAPKTLVLSGEKNGSNSVSWDGGWALAITGNTSKTWATASNISFGGKGYPTLKNSNGAQNTITVPEGVTVSNVTFYVVTNSDSKTATLSEFMGKTQDITVESKKDFKNPTVIPFDVADAPSSITFTFSTTQVCFIAVVTYTQDGEASDLKLNSAASCTIKAGADTKIDATATSAISYVSSNEKVATVDADGNVIAVAVGQAKISVSAAKTETMLAGNKEVVVNVYDFESEDAVFDADKYDDEVLISLTQDNVDKTAFITPSKDLNWAARILDGTTYLLPNCNTGGRSVSIKFKGVGCYILLIDNTGASVDRKLSVKLDGNDVSTTVAQKSMKSKYGYVSADEHTLVIEGVADNTLYPVSILFVKDGCTPTSINNVSNENVDSPAYNLQGQRVSPNAKGVVIKGGKKYFQK